MVKKITADRKNPRKYHIELTPFSAVLWGVFLFFILTWIFVLGILVGRGFLPGTVTNIADLRGQMKKLQGMVGSKESYDSIRSKDDETVPKLDFYNKLENKKDTARDNGKPEKEPDLLKVPLIDKNNTDPAEKVPEELLKMEPAAPDQHEESLANENKYTVQIASLAEKIKAEGMINRLIENGFDAYYYEALVDGKTYYRVRCGKFSTREEAQLYSLRLKNEEGIDGFVSRLE